MAESRNGATLQIYLALIALLLLQLQMGKRPSKRIWELMRWHSMGMASSEDVARQLNEMALAQARAEEQRIAREKFFRGARDPTHQPGRKSGRRGAYANQRARASPTAGKYCKVILGLL